MTFRPPAIAGWAPPWLDIEAMCWCLCLSEDTIGKLVKEGKLPQPSDRLGKRLWAWPAVNAAIAGDQTPGAESIGDLTGRIRDAARQGSAKRGF